MEDCGLFWRTEDYPDRFSTGGGWVNHSEVFGREGDSGEVIDGERFEVEDEGRSQQFDEDGVALGVEYFEVATG